MQYLIKGIAKFVLCLTIVFMTLSIGLATKSPTNYVYAVEGEVTVDATTFPDAIFRQWVLDNITSGSTTLTATMIANTTSINVRFKQITDLKGIEYFTALQSLECSTNRLTTLDVSKNTLLTNLGCSSNKLTDLDISKNTALTMLSCTTNQLTTLDVSKNTKLEILYCSINPLTTLDVSNNTSLISLGCGINKLTSLDISKNTKLLELACPGNQLTTLDLSNNTALENLFCYKNQLTTLDVSKNTALKKFECNNNLLTTLDVTKNTALTSLDCSNNQLTALDLSKQSATIDAVLNDEIQQAPVYKARQVGNKYVVDLKQHDAKINTAKISNLVSNGTYDASAATITYDSKPAATESIAYQYDTDSLNQNTEDMLVDGSVTVEVTPIPNTADNILVWFYTLLFVVSLIGVSGMVVYTKRKN